jgi:hypothetical protein
VWRNINIVSRLLFPSGILILFAWSIMGTKWLDAIGIGAVMFAWLLAKQDFIAISEKYGTLVYYSLGAMILSLVYIFWYR